jgi:hypothetical protein
VPLKAVHGMVGMVGMEDRSSGSSAASSLVAETKLVGVMEMEARLLA